MGRKNYVYIYSVRFLGVCVCVCVCVLYGPLSTFLAANLQLYHPGWIISFTLHLTTTALGIIELSQKQLVLELPLWSEGKGANSKVATPVSTP